MSLHVVHILEGHFKEAGLDDIKVAAFPPTSARISAIEISGTLPLEAGTENLPEGAVPQGISSLMKIRKQFLRDRPGIKVIGGHVIGFEERKWVVG